MSLSDIQTRLAQRGLYHGQIDSLWGVYTEDAVNRLLAFYDNAVSAPSHEDKPAPPAHISTQVVTAPALIRNPWPSQAGAEAFYGTPGTNLVHVTPPYPMLWDLDPGDGRGKPVNYVTVNQKCADSLLRCLKAVLAAYPDRAQLEAKHLHWFAGGYAQRNIRGGHATSMHSFGAAIDLAASWNAQHALYDESKGMMPGKVVAIFESEGWVWGGRWSPRSIDAMHFQAARVS